LLISYLKQLILWSNGTKNT